MLARLIMCVYVSLHCSPPAASAGSFSMQLIKVAAAELNQTPLAWATNQANIGTAIKMARAQQVTILCLPELCLTGYGCEDAFHAAGTWRTAWSLLQEILPQTRGMIVSLGMPLLYQHALYNTAC